MISEALKQTMKNFIQNLRLVNLAAKSGLLKNLGLLALSGLLAGVAWAQPVNDNFTNAIPLTGDSGSIPGNNTNATLETCESNTVPTDDNGVQPVDHSTWYVWTAPTNGSVEFDTFGSSFDTIVSVYSATNPPADLCDPNLMFVTADDNSGQFFGDSNPTSIASFTAMAGTTYYISVGGNTNDAGFDAGDYQLEWFFSPFTTPPPNDNFSSATVLTGDSGSTNVDNTSATPESGEPSHAGFIPSHSVWYQWTAPSDGEVTLDTIGSVDGSSNNLDTVLAVYTGTSLATLNQVAANDDLYPNLPSTQFNYTGQNKFTSINGINGLYLPLLSFYSQPYAGPSGLRFNAKAGVTYYFAVDTKSPLFTFSYPTQQPPLPFGTISLNWSYHPSGVFRFATEDVDQTGSGQLLYHCSETETSRRLTGAVNANQYDTTISTYYTYDAPGVLVTVTRVAGSSGRVSVDYATVDGQVGSMTNQDAAAAAGVDYTPVSGTLVFDDFEMSKTILIPVVDDFGLSRPNRDFTVVLSNPQLDMDESSAVSLPRVDAKFGTALVRILDVDTDPREVTGQRLNISTNFVKVPFQFISEIDMTGSNGAPTTATIPLNLTTNDPAVDTTGLSTNVFFLGTNIFVGSPASNTYTYSITIVTNATKSPISFSFTNNLTVFLSDGAMLTNIFTNNIILSNIPSSFSTNGLIYDMPTNAVFNFQKANFRVPRDVDAYWGGTPVTVYVNRTGTNNGAASINYIVNSYFLDDVQPQQNNQFPLQAGSDYAVPNPASTGGIKGTNSDFDFPGSATGTLSWDAKDFKPKPITFTVFNNKLTEFNKDFHIGLYDTVNNAVVQVGMVAETTVTVLFDDQSPPAGSVDEYYNPDFGINMTPPANATVENPGANGEVDALTVLPNNKTVIGGHFSAYSSGNNTLGTPDIARLNSDGTFDTAFHPGSGVSSSSFISSLAVDSASRIVIGGNFLSYNGTQRNGVARLNADGSLDTSFLNIGGGVNLNATVWSVVQQTDGKILIGGDFTSYNSTPRNHIARLNSDGSLDTTFNASNNINSTVYAISLQPASTTNVNVNAAGNGTQTENDNTISFGAPAGTLTINYNMQSQTNELQVFYGGLGGQLIFDTGLVTNSAHVVIPFAPVNGSVSDSLTIVVNPGGNQPGTNWNYNASIQAVTSNDLLLGGNFTSVGGFSGQDHIARLLDDGSVDPTFDPSAGINGVVYSLATQSDQKIVVGGEFSKVNGLVYNRIARLNRDGSLDTGFFCGSGADGTVYSVTALSSGTYLGGAFTSYNGTHRLGFARLNQDGSLDTSFLDTAYNQFAGLTRVFFDDTPGTVFTAGVQSDGNVMIGGSFDQVGGGQFSPLVRTNDEDLNIWPEPKQRDGVRNRSNVARLIGGSTTGPGNISMAYNNYAANKSQSSLFVTLVRTNGTLGYASANFSVQPGLAKSGVDYTYNAAAPLYTITWEYTGPTRMHSDGLFGTNTLMQDVYGEFWSYGINGPSAVNVSLLNNNMSAGDLQAQFQLANPSGADQFYLGGQDIPLGVALGGSAVPFTVVDDDRQSGAFGFVSSVFTANSTTASIGILRTNGSYGNVQLSYATVTNGSTAVPGSDYTPTTGTLTFNDGQTNGSFNVQILNTNNITPLEKTVNLVLYNLSGPPNGVATFSLSNAVLRIINSSFQGFLNFSTNAYSANLSAGVINVTVTRTVGSKGSLSVQYATADGPSATNGVDYTGSTNTLAWNDGDVSPRTIAIPLIPNMIVGGNKQFGISLTNATLNGTNTPSLLGGTTNATLTIVNDNSYGTFQFSAPSYVVNEGGGLATITVTRSGVSVGSVPVTYATADNTAFAGTNYVATNGSLTFLQGDVSKSFTVRIINDGVQDTNPFNFMVSLSVPPGVTTGPLTNVPVNILDAQSFNRPPGSPDTTFDPSTAFNASVLALALQSNGQIIAGGNFTTVNGQSENHIARLNTDGTLDSTGFMSLLSGVNGPVRALANQDDDRVVIGGAFTQVNGVVRNGISRLMVDGSLDSSFNPGSGADSPVYALAQTFVNGLHKIYAGGAFTTYNSSTTPGVVRLNDDGTIDSSFADGSGANGAVFALAVYPTNSPMAGKVLVGGVFTNFNSMPVNRLVRLNADGSMDTNFSTSIGTGANDAIRSIVLQADDEILLGGDFTNFNGVALNHIARLNANGTTDTNFTANAGMGANGSVNAIALQSDNRIVVAGQFTQASGVTRNNLTRLLPTGAVDPTINFGAGANADVDAVLVQPADQMLIIGGGFTQFNNETHDHIARIYGGSQTGSGAFEFTSGNYQIGEDGGSATISIRRTGGTSGTNSDGSGNVSINFVTVPGGTAVANVNYSNVTTTVTFPPGEVSESVTVPVIDDFAITPDLTVNLALTNGSPGTGIGDQPTAVLTIVNMDSAISFSSALYSRAKNAVDGVATIDLIRQGSTSGTSFVEFFTTTNGTALTGTDYLAVDQLVTFDPGVSDVQVKIPIINNNKPEGNTTVGLQLTNAIGSLMAAPSNAVLTIIDTVIAPGQLSFSTNNFVAGEADTNAFLTIVRSNGSSGFVSVNYLTVAGTAMPGTHYVTTSNTVTFADGVTNRTISIPIIDNNIISPPVSFSVVLSNPTGGATLATPTTATVTILENSGSRLVVPAGSTLISESGPVNGIIDSNETVTLLFAFRDNGTTNVGNLNATLVATNGITAPSGPQNYGSLVMKGPSVFRPFSFTVDPTYTNGQQISARFILQDGANGIGIGVFNYNLGVKTTTFANTNTIIINDDTNATPYPSIITVSNVAGTLLQATVVFTNVSHTSPSDIDALLTAPASPKGVLVMANAGGFNEIDNVTLTFDDMASGYLPQYGQIVSGTTKPTAYTPVATFFPTNAPSPVTNAPVDQSGTTLSVFNGTNPNGDWSLFVQDDTGGDFGVIANGWLLNVMTADPVGTFADVGIGMTSLPVVSVAISNNVTFAVTVTNYGPSSATNVIVTNTLPSGVAFVSANGAVHSGSLVIWNVGNLVTNAGAQLNIVVKSLAAGPITNSATVTTTTADPNPDDNNAAVIVNVTTAQPAVLSGASVIANNGGFQLTVTGTPGFNYIVQATTNLATTNWINIYTGAPPLMPPYAFIYTNLDSSNFPARFYRAITGP
jgi:uncharacterized delta-60 repeat protein